MLQSAPYFLDFSLSHKQHLVRVWVRARAHVVQNETVSCEHFYLREKMMGVDMWLMLVMLLNTLVGGIKMLLR